LTTDISILKSRKGDVMTVLKKAHQQLFQRSPDETFPTLDACRESFKTSHLEAR